MHFDDCFSAGLRSSVCHLGITFHQETSIKGCIRRRRLCVRGPSGSTPHCLHVLGASTFGSHVGARSSANSGILRWSDHSVDALERSRGCSDQLFDEPPPRNSGRRLRSQSGIVGVTRTSRRPSRELQGIAGPPPGSPVRRGSRSSRKVVTGHVTWRRDVTLCNSGACYVTGHVTGRRDVTLCNSGACYRVTLVTVFVSQSGVVGVTRTSRGPSREFQGIAGPPPGIPAAAGRAWLPRSAAHGPAPAGRSSQAM
jgi:hypothetical protein